MEAMRAQPEMIIQVIPQVPEVVAEDRTLVVLEVPEVMVVPEAAGVEEELEEQPRAEQVAMVVMASV
jgi:hypothetical protein